jgi:hypothetical protein
MLFPSLDELPGLAVPWIIKNIKGEIRLPCLLLLVMLNGAQQIFPLCSKTDQRYDHYRYQKFFLHREIIQLKELLFLMKHLRHIIIRSPSMALEGAKRPIITHTCHHRYAHQHFMGLTWALLLY